MNPALKVGILGGGQLARMLALSAHSLGLKPYVFSENLNDPAQQVTMFHHIGSLKDPSHLEKFLKTVDIATFESEFLNGSLLLQAQQKSKTPIYPSVATMELLQDRLTQKQNLDIYKIPTAPWEVISSPHEAELAAQSLLFPLVFKQRRFGYDGYGTFIVKNAAQLKAFTKKQFPTNHGFIVEKWIPFRRELACVFARNRSGQISHYPLVESLQKDSRCLWVKGPIQHPKFSSFAKQFSQFLKKMDYVGVIGVELFETSSGLLVNELAPRVHNTAHYTMSAFNISQFELHWRALLNQNIDLPPANAKGFAMVNLLGGSASPKPQWTLSPDMQLHWYGKEESRPGRKMGHINTLGTSPQQALQKALKNLKRIRV
jgi:5-(carboxyamino)imidazole ribonucleotide synthase